MSRVRAVFGTMGTVVSAEWCPPQHPKQSELTIESAFAVLDERFSLYRQDSELSQIARGELRLSDASVQLRSVYEEALDWRRRTEGAFTPHRPDGIIDLNGLVKALAIRDAGEELESTGITDWYINAGGDILTGQDSPARTVGIVDPDLRSRLLCSITLESPRHAVATSGSAERGDHIWTIESASAPEFTQATVIADDIVTADVLATAIVAGGRATLDLVTERWSVDVVAVASDATILMTPAIRRQFAAQSAAV
ncbi:MAG TPA: FAD:protein FMN transferase [Terrimesophilobacter sp.]|nr:FAD:protein FMN transferase [Terrimesophilobacter sp.]